MEIVDNVLTRGATTTISHQKGIRAQEVKVETTKHPKSPRLRSITRHLNGSNLCAFCADAFSHSGTAQLPRWLMAIS